MTQKRKQSEEDRITVVFVDEGVDGDGALVVVPYDAERDRRRANKFLYWPTTALSNGHALLAVGSASETLVNHAFLLDELIRLRVVERLQIPTGAGDITNGTVKGWQSTRLNIDTPAELIPAILTALGLD
jgi:hypothetical protein